MNKHYRTTILKQNLSLQINKYRGDRIELGLTFKYDKTTKSFVSCLSIGSYKFFAMAYKKVAA